MPKVKSRLTSREEKCLIDVDIISPERHDFALVLLCSRILYRCQLKCFQNTHLDSSDVCDIVQCEIEKLPELLSVIGASLEARGNYSINCHENLMMMDFRNQLLNSPFPLEVIKNLLVAEQSSRNHRGHHEKNIKKLYRNLVNMTEDLKKFMLASPSPSNNNNSSSTSVQSPSTRKRFQFRPIFFVNSNILSTEGVSNNGEESFINPPKPVLWLPVLTNKERITQRTTSAFSLRKKTEFTKNNGPSFRPQLLRMNFVQTFGSKGQPSTSSSSRQSSSIISHRNNKPSSPSLGERRRVNSLPSSSMQTYSPHFQRKLPIHPPPLPPITNDTTTIYENENFMLEYYGNEQLTSRFLPVTSINAIISHERLNISSLKTTTTTNTTITDNSNLSNMVSPSSTSSSLPTTPTSPTLPTFSTLPTLTTSTLLPSLPVTSISMTLVKPTPKNITPINTDPKVLLHPKNSKDLLYTPSSSLSPTKNCTCGPLRSTDDFRHLCPCIINHHSPPFSMSSDNSVRSNSLFNINSNTRYEDGFEKNLFFHH
ncbi:5174_t:CDS:2 [Diversispora eburnea]|uniref:5174_t:CDS:1 n=1 Tax=Diversispora eburnea TaxID=1213867 RepID=A0A9N9A3H0_9GLOM|nr:5174_t:CDS:2 [Diversispora eburnea]